MTDTPDPIEEAVARAIMACDSFSLAAADDMIPQYDEAGNKTGERPAWQGYIGNARAAIAAHHAALEKAGMRVVPVMMTPEMAVAWAVTTSHAIERGKMVRPTDIWTAMLAASAHGEKNDGE